MKTSETTIRRNRAKGQLTLCCLPGSSKKSCAAQAGSRPRETEDQGMLEGQVQEGLDFPSLHETALAAPNAFQVLSR